MKSKLWKFIAITLWVIESPLILLSIIATIVLWCYDYVGKFNKWLKTKYFGLDKPFEVIVKDPLTHEIVGEIHCKTEAEANEIYNEHWKRGYNVTIYNG